MACITRPNAAAFIKECDAITQGRSLADLNPDEFLSWSACVQGAMGTFAHPPKAIVQMDLLRQIGAILRDPA